MPEILMCSNYNFCTELAFAFLEYGNELLEIGK